MCCSEINTVILCVEQTEGEGNGKKLSKKKAAEKMVDELKKLPPLSPVEETPKLAAAKGRARIKPPLPPQAATTVSCSEFKVAKNSILIPTLSTANREKEKPQLDQGEA